MILQNFAQAYSESSRISKMEHLQKNSQELKAKSFILAKSSILDVRLGSELHLLYYNFMNYDL